MPVLLNPFRFIGPPPVASYIGTAQSTTDLTTYTLAATAIGTAAADRFVVVGIGGEGSAIQVSGVTIAGNAAALLVRSDAGTAVAALYGLIVAAGTTADIEVTFSGASQRCLVGVWTITGLQSTTPVDTAQVTDDSGNPMSVNVDIAEDGVVIGIGVDRDILTDMSFSAGPATDDFDVTIDEGATSGRHCGGHADDCVAASAQQVDCSFHGNVGSFAVVSLR